MMGHFPTLELPYMCNDLHINLCYKNNVFYDPFFFQCKGIILTYTPSCGGVCDPAVDNSNSGSGVPGFKPCLSFFFDKTRNFTPFCLSSPWCINGYRRHTARG